MRTLTALRGLFVAACLAASHTVIADAPIPEYAKGERWTYEELEPYSRVRIRTQQREVVEAARGAVQVSVRDEDAQGAAAPETWIYAAPGILAAGRLSDRVNGSYQPPLALLPQTLGEGMTWSQIALRTDAVTGTTRRIDLRGTTLGWETLKVAAGEFRALKIKREMWLGDHETFRTETWRTEFEWYVPELKGPAKIDIWEQHFDPTVSRTLRSRTLYNRRLFELRAYQPGSAR